SQPVRKRLPLAFMSRKAQEFCIDNHTVLGVALSIQIALEQDSLKVETLKGSLDFMIWSMLLFVVL
ncbi:MAG: hypothetical protein ACRDHZ_26620, partial [Ktedonobacteraceae bacterium]